MSPEPEVSALPGGLPFDARDWTFDRLLSHSSQAYRQHWPFLVFLVLLLALWFSSLALVGLAFEQAAPGLWNSFGALVSLVVMETVRFVLLIGLLRLMVDVMRGLPPRIAVFFLPLRRLGQLLVVEILLLGALAGAAIVLALVDLLLEQAFGGSGFPMQLLTVILVLLVGLSLIFDFTFAGLEVVCDLEVGAFQAVRRAFRMARGTRLRLLMVYLLAILEAGVGIVLLGAGFFLTLGLAMALLATLFLVRRSTLDLPPISETDLPPATAD